MSILIKGMDMPNPQSRPLWCVIHSDGTVEYDSGDYGWQILKQAAVPVPPHGRLIDADALEKSIVIQIELCKQLLKLLKCSDNIHDIANQCGVLEEILEEIKNTPTVIPADEEDETDFS